MAIQVKHYREMARRLGGVDGELVNELTDAYLKLAEKSKDELLNSVQVASMLGIHPNNMHHKRKTKYFPKPNFMIGNRNSPMWYKSTIQYYMDHIDQWRTTAQNNL